MAVDALKRLLAVVLVALPMAAGAQTISNLPAASLPLSGAETTVVVQGGTTKKTTVANIAGTVTLPTTSANELLGNATSSATTAYGVPLPNCPGTLNALTYTNGSGFGCTNLTGAFLTQSLPSGTLFVGNGSGVATGVALSGDCTLANTGAVTCTKTNGTAFAASATTNALNASNINAGTLGTAYGGTGTTTSTGSGANVLGTSPTIASPLFTGTVTGNGAIPNAVLANSSVTVAGRSCALGGTCFSASGSTTTLGTTSGTLTPTHCVQIDASGNLTDAGGTCTTGGGGGTVSSGTAGQVAYYASNGTVVSGTSNFKINTNGVGFGGGIINAVRTITASGAVTVATTDYFLCVNKTVGAATAVNLPSTPATGQTFIVKDCKGDAATNNITITPSAGNIDGGSTFVMNYGYESASLVYSGSAWSVF